MLIPFRRDYLVVRLILRSLTTIIAVEIAVIGFGVSRPLFTLGVATAVWAVVGAIAYLWLLLGHRRYHLALSARGLEFVTPAGFQRIDWKDVTRVGITGSSDTIKRVRFTFEGGSSSTRSSRWIGLKTFGINCRALAIDPGELLELVRSQLDAVRASMSRQPIEISKTASATAKNVALGLVAVLLAFSRMMNADIKANDKAIQTAVGAPIKWTAEVHDIDVGRWIGRYPRDPRVRLALAEKLVDDNHFEAAFQELRQLDGDQATLMAFDSFGRLEAEIHSTMAAALLKQDRKAAAHAEVGPFCKDLTDGAFERMRKLDLCHYS